MDITMSIGEFLGGEIDPGDSSGWLCFEDDINVGVGGLIVFPMTL